MKITIIGNNAHNGAVSDGGRIKIRLYKELLEKEGHLVNVIDLDGWKKHVFSIFSQIKRAIKEGNRIVVMAGPKGCRRIIPIVNHYNKKQKSKVVFCTLGVGTLDYLIKDLNSSDAQSFLHGNYSINNKDEKMGNLLKKLDFVVVENNLLKERYESFYKLNNVVVLENFRDSKISPKEYDNSPNRLRIVYASRIKGYKGTLDLMNAVVELNKLNNRSISLDMYGDYQLNDDESAIFNKLMNDSNKLITYHGVISESQMLSELKKYDLFCLPTKYHGEGTPGSLVESLIAGTPALVSSYSQAKELINNGVTGFIYEFGSYDDLKDKIQWILNNKSLLPSVGAEAQKMAVRFTYDGNKDMFLKVMVGE